MQAHHRQQVHLPTSNPTFGHIAGPHPIRHSRPELTVQHVIDKPVGRPFGLGQQRFAATAPVAAYPLLDSPTPKRSTACFFTSYGYFFLVIFHKT